MQNFFGWFYGEESQRETNSQSGTLISLHKGHKAGALCKDETVPQIWST